MACHWDFLRCKQTCQQQLKTGEYCAVVFQTITFFIQKQLKMYQQPPLVKDHILRFGECRKKLSFPLFPENVNTTYRETTRPLCKKKRETSELACDFRSYKQESRLCFLNIWISQTSSEEIPDVNLSKYFFNAFGIQVWNTPIWATSSKCLYKTVSEKVNPPETSSIFFKRLFDLYVAYL